MLSTIHSDAVSQKSKDTKLRGHRGVLEVNLGPPFHLLLDADSDLETPSPLTICFDFPKPPASPLRATEWTDSDTDSDSDAEPHVLDEAQYISIPHDSPFYCAPPPPAFQNAFDISPVAVASPPLTDDEEHATAQFRTELQRILPSDLKNELFLIDEDCLRGIDEELFSAPLDAFMDVCLARLRPATAVFSGRHATDEVSVKFARRIFPHTTWLRFSICNGIARWTPPCGNSSANARYRPADTRILLKLVK
ncbi:hypothetical protein C8R47DRAFT_434509 [Mycena vitilis]|nr:hypothetical protein C8R47DRAFT_434509 [Mycena vitilis]